MKIKSLLEMFYRCFFKSNRDIVIYREASNELEVVRIYSGVTLFMNGNAEQRKDFVKQFNNYEWYVIGEL